MATIEVVVSGALGRMGRTVCGAVVEADDMLLVGGADPGAAEASDPGGAVPGLPFCATDLSEAFDRVEAAGSAPEGGHRVVVDFTQPHAVAENIALCVARGWPAVVGTTGLEPDALDRLAAEAERTGIPVLVAPNFAIGAVLMMEFARQAARLLDACEIVELHHEAKLDAPSGTARRTADSADSVWSTMPSDSMSSERAARKSASAFSISPIARACRARKLAPTSSRRPLASAIGPSCWSRIGMGSEIPTANFRSPSSDV